MEALAYVHLANGVGPQAIKSMQGPRHPIATGGPVLDIDLAAKARQLQGEHYGSGSRNAMTLVKHRDFRMVLAAVRAGARLCRHSVRGTVLLQILRRHVRIRVLEEFLDATVGHIVSLDSNLDHEVTAVEDALLLITIAWPEASQATSHQYLGAELLWGCGVDPEAEAIGPRAYLSPPLNQALAASQRPIRSGSVIAPE